MYTGFKCVYDVRILHIRIIKKYEGSFKGEHVHGKGLLNFISVLEHFNCPYPYQVVFVRRIELGSQLFKEKMIEKKVEEQCVVFIIELETINSGEGILYNV